jgi:4-diphosphocytidyl-2-C-methyl-D-erythritol kinase
LFRAEKGAALTLDKQLPVASGIGGGSADAAATLQALSRLWGRPLPAAQDILSLGADVPVCLAGRPVRMTGVGEGLHPLMHPLPPAALVLANPGVALATPDVFAALERRENPALPRDLPRLRDTAELAAFLSMTRNDLEPPAIRLAPVIGRVKSALSAQPGCRIARMSGSGATCFGLFDDPLAAAAAAASLRRAEPGWWVVSAAVRP